MPTYNTTFINDTPKNGNHKNDMRVIEIEKTSQGKIKVSILISPSSTATMYDSLVYENEEAFAKDWSIEGTTTYKGWQVISNDNENQS